MALQVNSLHSTTPVIRQAIIPEKELQERDYEVFLRESVLNIQEVVIRANRMEQQYQKTAQEVRSIDSETIRPTVPGKHCGCA